MKKSVLFLLSLVFMLTIFSLVQVPSALSDPMLKMVTIDVKAPGQINKLAGMGIDIAEVVKGPMVEDSRGVSLQTYRVKAVVSARDEKKLALEKFSWSDVPGRGPIKKIGEEYEVYKSFDAPKNGIKAQLHKIQATYPRLCRLKTIGHSLQNRKMLAMGITNEKIKGEKPQVLLLATHHAREWVATQMAMRMIKYLTSNFGSDERVTDLLNTTEVWVIPVANPDGYQYSFTNERLWRKNMRDNDGDGEITIADGVDLNRNFASRWGLDEEGASFNPTDSSYRGTAPNSEPETQAVVTFIEDKDFKFIVSYHTSGNLILYPWGWQVKTTSLDDPIFVAQAGTDAEPAIWDSLVDQGYDPGVGADLYITNGNFIDWTYASLGIPSYTVEFTKGYAFRFPDDEGMVQTVFEDSLEFALSIAESAADPAHPVSPVGLATQNFYHIPVTSSHGPNQMIEVLALKGLPLTLTASGGDATLFTEKLGNRYNDKPGTYYSRYVAYITGQSEGSTVTYSIDDGSGDPELHSYQVAAATGNPILVLAAEDYDGENNDPVYTDSTAPNFLHYYTDALDAGGYAYDVYDMDEKGLPGYAEVLSHYETVIWYTGNGYLPGMLYSDVPEAEVLNVRELLNYNDGKLLATGQDFSTLSTHYGWFSDDFYQYYLGAYMTVEGSGMGSDGLPIEITGETEDPVFDGLNLNILGGDGADNQLYASSFIPISNELPHYVSSLAAWYDRSDIFEPRSGDYYLYTQEADESFKRLGATITLPSGSPFLKFWVFFDIEKDWDFAFVEISEVGSDVWTTLPDTGGLSSTDTGDSCVSGWVEQIHPFLANYMDGDCNPSGSTGDWHGYTDKSGGWRQLEFDLSAHAGKTVELYISYASDWGSQNLGVFIDDIELSGYDLEDFETGMGIWETSTVPGSGAINNWIRRTSFDLPDGPVIRTPDTVYMGFGFEAIDNAMDREELMNKTMKYLGQ
ncbi:MAG: zinc carboxypeptidase [Desulfobacteraceae bacterium]|nr:zinc carboxypeptidase [Desulfobacteraceae bacterium]